MQSVVFEFDYSPEDMPVEKDAKIFEAGEYPDKGIKVSEEDLDTIVRNFAEAPVKVEHTDSPLDPLGTVKRVWRQGRELFARLAFPSDMAAFLERRGVKKLSIALHKDPLRLAEVSLVLSPRVPTAAMFAEDQIENGRRDEREKGSEASPIPPISPSPMQYGGEVNEKMSQTRESESNKEIAELRFALRAKDVDVLLADLKSRGKLTPASEIYAREMLLKGDGKVTFGEGETTFAQLFECFMEAQPPVIVFGEVARADGSIETGSPLTAEEEELLTKLGITREQFKKYI